MACCSEYQTECLRVVTIGYIKDFIGTDIQDSTNGSSKSISRTDDTYCPTYSELTGGTIIQTWSQDSTTPRYDRDGIVVNETCTGTGERYADNQLVNQKDFSMKYTRFNDLSISSSKTSNLDPCGESTTITTTYNYTRYTKSMNASCAVPTPASSSSNGACADLSWHTEIGSVSNCNSYTIGKNSSSDGEAPARCDYVSATTTFRSASKASNKIEICQKALTGDYTYATGRTRKQETGIDETHTTPTNIYGCNVNQTVSMTATGYYNLWREYAWVDSCGTVYPSKTTEKLSDADKNKSENAGSDSHTFRFNVDCCEGGYSEQKTLRVTYGSYSTAVTYNAICESCADDPSQCGEPPCCKIIGAASVGCSGQYQYKVVDCGEPETCGYIVVDGSREYDETNWADSSRITTEGRFTAEVYDNIPDGIINNYEDLKNDAKVEQAMAAGTMWMMPFSTGRTGTITGNGVSITVSLAVEDDDFWVHSPCVAAKLQWKAGLLPEPECLSHGCSWDCWEAADPCDDICRDQYYITGDTNMGTASYNVSSSGTSGNRLIIIYWYPEGGEETYKMCPSKRNMCYLPR